LAKRGYSRDKRSDCKQVVLALVVTREGFPLAHYTLAGNTQDVKTVRRIVGEIETRFGKSQRVWVMDRGMISEDTLSFLNEDDRRYLLATRRHELTHFQAELGTSGWQQMPEHPGVAVKALPRDGVYYLLARSHERKKKERAMRRRERRPLAAKLRKLQVRVAKGRLKNRDKILEAIGRLKERYPKGARFVELKVTDQPALQIDWQVSKFKEALQRDGAYLLRSNQGGWTAQEFWETYMQLTVVERAFRVLKSELLLRPIWHHYDHRTEAHVFVCVLAYALWKTLDHLAKRAGLQTLIRKPDLDADGNDIGPKPRPMTPEVILRELSRIQIGDIELATVDGRRLQFRRVARPNAEQRRILQALGLEMPERLSPDRIL
jgi:transposase